MSVIFKPASERADRSGVGLVTSRSLLVGAAARVPTSAGSPEVGGHGRAEIDDACALVFADEHDAAARAATEATAAIDKTLSALTAPHHGPPGAARWSERRSRSTCAVTRKPRATLRKANEEAPAPGALDTIKSDPAWAAIIERLS